MLEAQRRFDLLVQRATPEVIDASVARFREGYLPSDLDSNMHAHVEAVIEMLNDHGGITSDAQQAWRALQTRVVDETVSARLAQISETLVVGATSGGEVSAATFAFPDRSHLILMDHGLVTLTWLLAQLFVVSRRAPLLGQPPPDQPIALDVAARTLRLAISSVLAGGRAGAYPSLLLSTRDLGLAGLLVREMDIFVMAHEAAHILLSHFDADRTTVGVVGGSNQVLGRRQDEETAADLLAVTLQFDDVLAAGEAESWVVELRLIAIHLFLTVVRLYEQSMFIVQPTSHPPADVRWQAIIGARVTRWFDDLNASTLGSAELVQALADVGESPRLTDAQIVHSGLGDRLDRTLWDLRDWSSLARLSHLLLPTAKHAVAALRDWPGWPDGADINAWIAEIVGAVLTSDAARGIVRTAIAGTKAVSRLDAVQALTAVSDVVNGQPEHSEPFPSWAIASIVLDAIASAQSAVES
jgi:hypothetical protein